MTSKVQPPPISKLFMHDLYLRPTELLVSIRSQSPVSLQLDRSLSSANKTSTRLKVNRKLRLKRGEDVNNIATGRRRGDRRYLIDSNNKTILVEGTPARLRRALRWMLHTMSPNSASGFLGKTRRMPWCAAVMRWSGAERSLYKDSCCIWGSNVTPSFWRMMISVVDLVVI